MNNTSDKIWVLWKHDAPAEVFTRDCPRIPPELRDDVCYVRADDAGSIRRADSPPTPDQIVADPRVRALVDASENVVIAIGMGWDLDGVCEALCYALAALGRKP